MGKRKMNAVQADGGEALSTTSLFVRNLSFDTTNEQLEELFSDIGPIKTCFVVANKANKVGRGFGIVHYAVAEDAVEAIKKLQGRNLQGRQIKIEYAKKRAPQQKRKKLTDESTVSSPSPVTEHRNKVSADGDNESDHDDNGSASSDDNSSGSGSDGGSDDGETVDNSGEVSADDIPKKDLDGNRKPQASHTTKFADESSTKNQRKPKSERAASSTADGRTIILTGLPSSVNAKNLYKRCRKIADIEKGGVTVKPSNIAGKPGQCAEVIYVTHKTARLAATKLNNSVFKGAKIGAAVKTKAKKSVVLGDHSASDKGDKAKRFRLIVRNLSFSVTEQALRTVAAKFGPVTEVTIVRDKETSKPRGFAFVKYKSAIDAGVAVTGLNGKAILGRKIAVDWTVAKNEYEAALKKSESLSKDAKAKGTEEENDGNRSDESNNDNDSDDEGGNSDDDDKDESNDEDDDDDEDEDEDNDYDDDNDDNDDDEEDEIEKSSDVNQGCTVFVRNVSFDTTEEQLKQSFEPFGTVALCKVVEDFNTGRSRGTAFVKFKTQEEAQACIDRASNTQIAPIECDGRALNVTIAVDRKEAMSASDAAAKVRDEKKEMERKLDKRNLYLLREGLIMNNTSAYKAMSAADRSLRQNLEMESKAKAKNPNLAVSKTRVSVHNMPLTLTEVELRKLVLKHAPPEEKLLQAKIVRSKDRVGPDGKMRSKGFGFLEFENHDDALKAIRMINNNPALFTAKKRPIVQFAWIDVRVISKILRRRELSRVRVERAKAEGVPLISTAQKKRDRRIEKRKLRKEQYNNGVPIEHQKEEKPSANAPGTTARPGKLASRSKQVVQTKPSPKPNKKKKVASTLAVSDSSMREPKAKRSRKRKAEDAKEQSDEFDSMVDKYRSKLMNSENASRWS